MKRIIKDGFVYVLVTVICGVLIMVLIDEYQSRNEVAAMNVGKWNAAIERVNSLGLVEFNGELYTIERAKKERDAWQRRLK